MCDIKHSKLFGVEFWASMRILINTNLRVATLKEAPLLTETADIFNTYDLLHIANILID